jgi:hypothetical protein
MSAKDKNNFVEQRVYVGWARKAQPMRRAHFYISKSHYEQIAQLIQDKKIENASALIRILLDDFFEKNKEAKENE